MSGRWTLAISGLLLAGALASGGMSRAQTSATPRSGEAIYTDKCVYCHDTRGWATRILARRTPPGEARIVDRKALPEAYVRTVVRRGIGSMPGFTPTDLSDAEIAVVAKWLDKSAAQ